MAGLVCQYAEAMNDAANSLLHGAKVRGADYRMRAEELRMRAAAITFADIQSSLLEVANTYDALAQAIENAAEKQRSPDPSESPCSRSRGRTAPVDRPRRGARRLFGMRSARISFRTPQDVVVFKIASPLAPARSMPAPLP